MVAAFRSAAASLVRARAPLTIARQAVVAPRFTPVRFYAASAGLSKSDIEARIVDVLKTFEKVEPAKVRFQYSEQALSGAKMLPSGRVVHSAAAYTAATRELLEAFIAR